MKNTEYDQLAFIDRGKGIPILFIHGYPLSKKLWEEQVEDLSPHFRCIVPDLRGYGGSGHLPIAGQGRPYSMEMLADDCSHLLSGLGIEEPVVVSGLSMGGYISFAFYRRFPQQVRALVLTATRAGADSPEAQAARDNAIAIASQSGAQSIIASLLPKLLAPLTPAKDPKLVQRVEGIMKESTVEGIIASLQAMKTRPDSTPWLPKISCPTLIIHGSEDQIMPVIEAHTMKNNIPGAKLVMIEGAGHLPNVEQPEKYNQELQGFLRSL